MISNKLFRLVHFILCRCFPMMEQLCTVLSPYDFSSHRKWSVSQQATQLHQVTICFLALHLTCHNKCQDTATFCDMSHTTAAICLLCRDRQLSMLDRYHIESCLRHARSHLKPMIQLYLNGITTSQGASSWTASCHIISVDQSTCWYTSTTERRLYAHALTLHTKGYKHGSGPAPSSILLLILSMGTGKGFW